MSRRPALALVLAVAASLALVAHPAMAAESNFRIRQVDMHSFPAVTVTVSISGKDVSGQGIQVTENGRTVSGVTVQRLTETSQVVDVVLAIDTSNSMQGTALESAIAAARDFVQAMPPGIRVGIVMFDAQPRVVQAITPDHDAVLSTLSLPPTTAGTTLYDAVGVAAGLFPALGQHNIVLLTDGLDTASKLDEQGALASAQRAHAAIFSIGLKTGRADTDVLQTLANRSGGTFTPASRIEDLSHVYQTLAGTLSQQFLLSYRSASPRGIQVLLGVRALEGSDSAFVITPRRPPAIQGKQPASRSQFGGNLGLIFALGLAFLAVFVLISGIGGGMSRSRRERSLARRMGARTKEGPERPDRAEQGVAAFIPDPFVAAAQRVAQVGGLGSKLDRKLERAGLPFRAAEFLAMSGGAVVVGSVIGALLLRNLLFALIVGVAAGLIPSMFLNVSLSRRIGRIHGQLADVLMILASSLRAGHSFFQALDMASKEVGDPAGPEFARVVAEIRLGRPVDEALESMADRIGSEDFKWAVLALTIQREVGGNLAELLDTVAETIRERDAVRRQVKVLTAEGRFSMKILTGIPFLIAGYVAIVNPEYLGLLFSTGIGLAMIGVAAVLMVLGYLWMRKIVRIDV